MQEAQTTSVLLAECHRFLSYTAEDGNRLCVYEQRTGLKKE